MNMNNVLYALRVVGLSTISAFYSPVFLYFYAGHLFTNEQYLWPLFERVGRRSSVFISVPMRGGQTSVAAIFSYICLWFYFGFMRLEYQQSIMIYKLCTDDNQK